MRSFFEKFQQSGVDEEPLESYGFILVSRNIKDLKEEWPDIRVLYQFQSDQVDRCCSYAGRLYKYAPKRKLGFSQKAQGKIISSGFYLTGENKETPEPVSGG